MAIKPDYAKAHHNLGSLLMTQGRLAEAGDHYRKALQIAPDDADTHYGLGNVLMGLGQLDEAMTHYRKALQIKPDRSRWSTTRWVSFRRLRAGLMKPWPIISRPEPSSRAIPTRNYHLAWLRATCPKASLRNAAEAVECAERANQLCGGRQPNVLDALAAAYAEAGRFPDALTTRTTPGTWPSSKTTTLWPTPFGPGSPCMKPANRVASRCRMPHRPKNPERPPYL